mgnify:CR=1 FL=1
MRTHIRTRLVGLTTLLLTLSLAVPAFGTSVLRVDTATHLLDSSAVVEGVVGVAKQSVDPATGRPVTDTTVRVDGVLWGSAAKGDLVVRQHKGSVEGMSFRIPGDGELEPGQRVVLFLNRPTATSGSRRSASRSSRSTARARTRSSARSSTASCSSPAMTTARSSPSRRRSSGLRRCAS